MASVAEIVEGHGICICAGSGGVGKTTTSAALAAGLAARGQKVCVLTIDPAKRLADSLGLKELENTPSKVDPGLFESAGVEMRGEPHLGLHEQLTELLRALDQTPGSRGFFYFSRPPHCSPAARISVPRLLPWIVSTTAPPSLTRGNSRRC